MVVRKDLWLPCEAEVLAGLALCGRKHMNDEFHEMQYAGKPGFTYRLVIKYSKLSALSVPSDANILPWKLKGNLLSWFESSTTRTFQFVELQCVLSSEFEVSVVGMCCSGASELCADTAFFCPSLLCCLLPTSPSAEICPNLSRQWESDHRLVGVGRK